MKALLASALGLSLLATPALAQEWRLVILDDFGATGVDAQAVTRTGDVARGRFIMVMSSPDAFGPDLNLGHIVEESEYNCAQRTVRDLAVEFFDPAGVSQGGLPETAFEPVGAGTPREDKMNAVCTGTFLTETVMASESEFIGVSRAYYAENPPGQ